VVSIEAYGRHVCILRMLLVLSSFPRSKRETWFLVDFAAHPPHVFARPPHVFVPVLRACRLPLHAFAPVLRACRFCFDCATCPPYVFVPALLAYLFLEATAQDTQTLIPALRILYRVGLLLD
jgi:hypothetical protein